MYKVLILICSLGTSPAECQAYNAVDVIQGPEAFDEVDCGLHGQAYMAQIALGAPHRDDEYVKVSCTRTNIGKNVG